MLKSLSTILLVGTTAAQSLLTEVTDAPVTKTDEGYFQRFGKYVETEVETLAHFGVKETVHEHNVVEGIFSKSLKMAHPFSYEWDYEQQAKHLNDITDFVSGEKEFRSAEVYGEDDFCANHRGVPDPTDQFALFPWMTEDIKVGVDMPEFEGSCFESIKMHLEYADSTKKEIVLTVTTEKPKTMTCSDGFFFANDAFHFFEDIFFRGTHTYKITPHMALDYETTDADGLNAFLFCSSYKEEMLSVLHTIKGLAGGAGLHGKIKFFQPKVPEYMTEAAVKFLNWTIGWQIEKREINEVVPDKAFIKSGDFLTVLRLDGKGPMQLYGTGGHVNHCTMAMWIEEDGVEELYVIESQSGWYWPTDRIQRNKFDDWIQFAKEASFAVGHLPLRKEYQEIFDSNKQDVLDYFYQIQGMPYGYHNYLFGWIDSPLDNLPQTLPGQLIAPVFSLIESFAANTTQLFFADALNQRLGVSGKNLSEISNLAGLKNMTVMEVASLVEEDSFVYHGYYHDGIARTCSPFVTEMYMKGGIFGDLIINSAEFTPKDVYFMDIFEAKPERPQACIDADPDADHCQFLGDYRITYPGLNSVPLYSHMMEHCTGHPPHFIRPEGC